MALTARMVTIERADPIGRAKFRSEAAGYEVRWPDDDHFLILAPSSGGGVRIGLQRVSEVKRNRVHIEWVAGDPPGEVARPVGLGAAVMAEHVLLGIARTGLADPEGNEFCISGHG